MVRDINREAKTLLGADLKIEANRPMTDSLRMALELIEGERAQTTDFVSMVLFPKNGGTRLAQISALEGNYPFYGNFNTEPLGAVEEIRALLDKNIWIKLG